MDVISYALSKKVAASAVSGVKSMSVDGTTLNIDTNDGQRLQMVFPQPSNGKDGISVTDIDVNANNQIVFTMSDGSEIISGKIPTVKGDPFKYSDFTQEQLDSLKGSDGFSPSAKIEKVGDTATITITDKDGTTTATIKDGKDGQGGGTADVPIEKIKVNGELQTPVNKVVDITVPDAYDDTEIRAELADKADTDHTHTTVNGHTVESDVPVDAKFTDTVYDDTQVKTAIQTVANGLMDSVGYSADYKTIDIIAKNGVKKSVNVAPIISHASITELSDVDTTNKATGKALVYNATTSKHEYADVSGTDEKVKMDASTDAKYLGELLDNITIANENGELKVKKLDGQEVTITEINYLKGLTMNVMDLVNMFSNGGVKIINTPVATYAELLTLDKSSFIKGISYLVYVLADENHDNAKTTYLVDKDSKTPTYFGFADSQRDFVTNPIDLATEITGKLGISNMDSDAIKALFTVDDTYKTETATNNAFSTHGAKALYDELLLAIGNKANDSDLTAHKDDTDIHVSTEDRTKWDSAKTHADSAHAPSNAQENVLETVKVNGTALEVSDKAVNVTVPTKVAELTDSADYAKKTDLHSHDNKSVLDGITSDKVTAWDNKSEFSGSYNDLNDKPTIDAELSNTSENAIQNKVVTKEINKLYSDISFNDFNTATDGTSFTDAEDGNMIVTDWTKNLLNPTLKTTTQNGVTCTNNGDGTYTLNGTATADTFFWFSSVKTDKNVSYNCLGTPHSLSELVRLIFLNNEFWQHEWGTGVIIKDCDKITPSIFVPNGKIVSDVIVKPMITTDLSATYDDFVPYGGYKIKSRGKNLFNPMLEAHEKFGVTCTKNIDTNGKPNGTYTINGTSTKDRWISFGYTTLNPGKYKFIATENNARVGNLSVSSNGVGIAMPGDIFIIQSKCVCDIGLSTWSITFNNVLIKPMITTDLSATYDDFEPYTDETITVTNDTESPAFGLKSHKGITNIISPGNVKCVYPTNESGKGVLDAMYNKDKMLTEQNKSLEMLGKCKNLLNATLQTTTKNGVTCTANGDGTYTLNGTTTSSSAGFNLIGNEGGNSVWLTMPADGKIIFAKGDAFSKIGCAAFKSEDGATMWAGGIIPKGTNIRNIYISVWENQTLNNVVIKPMLTTDLNATYDDFVPYTGDGETLASDVAEIKNDLGGLTFSASGTTLSITDGTNTWTLGANS